MHDSAYSLYLGELKKLPNNPIVPLKRECRERDGKLVKRNSSNGQAHGQVISPADLQAILERMPVSTPDALQRDIDRVASIAPAVVFACLSRIDPSHTPPGKVAYLLKSLLDSWERLGKRQQASAQPVDVSAEVAMLTAKTCTLVDSEQNKQGVETK